MPSCLSWDFYWLVCQTYSKVKFVVDGLSPKLSKERAWTISYIEVGSVNLMLAVALPFATIASNLISLVVFLMVKLATTLYSPGLPLEITLVISNLASGNFATPKNLLIWGDHPGFLLLFRYICSIDAGHVNHKFTSCECIAIEFKWSIFTLT